MRFKSNRHPRLTVETIFLKKNDIEHCFINIHTGILTAKLVAVGLDPQFLVSMERSILAHALVPIEAWPDDSMAQGFLLVMDDRSSMFDHLRVASSMVATTSVRHSVHSEQRLKCQ